MAYALMQAYMCLLHRGRQWWRCSFLPSVTCAGGPYFPPLCTGTPWHMQWSEGCWCWTKPTVTCTGGLFFPKAVAHILNACIETGAVLVEVVAVVVVVVGRNIVTCTV